MNNTSAANITEDHRSGISMKVPSKTEGIVWCSVFALASAFIVVGNLLTIVLFAVDKRLRKKSLFLVISMAFADLLLGAVSMPLYIYMELGDSLYQLWTGSMDTPLIYRLFSIADNVAIVASLLSATFISCERFYAIYRPFKHRTLTVRTYGIIIFTLWALAALDTGLGFLPDLGIHYFYIWPSLGSISTIIICGCNIAIWIKFQHGSVAGSQQQNRDLQNKRLTKTLVLVSFLALFCWLPFIIVFSVDSLNHDVVIPWRYLVIISFVNYSNAIVNPVMYAFRIPEFRQALALCCQIRRRATGNTENLERRNNKAAVLRTPTQLRTLQINSNCLELEFFDEEVIMDTKL